MAFLKSTHKRRSSGTVLPMLAMMILPLILVMGFAIDTGLILNSKNQQELIVQHAALSALSQYSKTMAQLSQLEEGQTRSDLVREAVTLVKARVSRIAKTNVTIIDKRLANEEDRIANESDEIEEREETNEASDAPILSSSDEAVIEFGQYYYNDEVSDEFPEGACKGKAPCFVPRSPEEVDRNNSIRFTMQVTKSNSIQTYILKLIGIGGVSHSASATATLIPRNDVFLLDLSPTAYYDNYNQKPVEVQMDPLDPSTRVLHPATASKFTYTMQNPTSGGTTAQICFEGVDSNNRCVLKKRWSFDSNTTYDPLYYSPEELGCGLSPKPPCPDGYVDSFNYRQNYKIVKVSFKRNLYDNDETENFTESFVVHAQDPKQSDANSPFPKPQPMTSILRAVNSGMEILADRALSTDHLGIYAFDSDRNFETSTDGLIVSEFPRFVQMAVPDKKIANFKRYLSATKFESQQDFDMAMALGLFPRTFTFSDLQAALYLGLSKISGTPTYRYAKNSIFLFTDGLANCPHETIADENDSSRITIPYLFRGTEADDYGENANCDGKNPKHLVEGIKRIIDPKFIYAFKDRNISVNIAIMGKHAHQLARKSLNKPGCMNASEASKYDPAAFVDSEVPDTAGFTSYDDPGIYEPGEEGANYLTSLRQKISTGQPLYVTAELYKIVHETKGMWIPIVPPLLSGGQPVDFSNTLNEACNEATWSEEELGLVRDLEVGDVKVTDSKGRILYDPAGRSPEQQMKEAMELVLQSPFVLVE